MKFCFPKLPSTSSAGLWMQDSFLRAYLPLIMIQITLIIIISRVLHSGLRRLGQPVIVSQVLTGILLGPTALGRIQFFKLLFALNKTIALKTVGLIGLTLFQFMIGVKIELGMMKKSGKKAVAVGVLGMVVPYAVLQLALMIMHTQVEEDEVMRVRLFTSSVFNAWTFTSIVVVACLLDELNLLNSKLGRLAVTASLVELVAELIVRRIRTMHFIMKGVGSSSIAYLSTGSFFAFVAFLFFVARPLTKWMVKRTPKGQPLSEAYFAIILFLALFCGFMSDLLGHQATMGMFMLGLALPSGPPLGSTLVERLETFITELCLPVFVAVVGMYSNFGIFLGAFQMGTLFLSFNVILVVVKTISVMAPVLYCGMSFHDALTLALIMNAKGIVELQLLNGFVDGELVGERVSTVLLFNFMVLMVVISPLVKFMYKPSKRYLGYKRRTIQHSKNIELRLLTCIHGQEQAPPVINLLESLCTDDQHSPLFVYVIHLNQLVGRVTSIVLPYRKGKNSSHVAAATDHIASAFWTFEQKKGERSISVQPYICLSPYAGMYDDVCTMAVEKKVSMIILPFHKSEMNSALESENQANRAVNVDVLRYAPCSVGILVEHGLVKDTDLALTNLLNNIVVYFFGSADDREAMSLAMRMAANERIGVTVIHFVAKSREQLAHDHDIEHRLDSEVLHEFRSRNVERRNLVYREEVVEDGEEMVEVIRHTSNSFDLIIVGRREGKESELTEGLSAWSEYPELGVVGDMISSTDFGIQVSTLIVQQQSQQGRASN